MRRPKRCSPRAPSPTAARSGRVPISSRESPPASSHSDGVAPRRRRRATGGWLPAHSWAQRPVLIQFVSATLSDLTHVSYPWDWLVKRWLLEPLGTGPGDD